jgi:cytochrome c-type biogenesis protein CcmH/NrfF
MLKPKVNAGEICGGHVSRRSFFLAASAAAAVVAPALVHKAHAQERIQGVNESGIMSPEVQRCGMRLACLCGSCTNTVGDCAMLECGYCLPMRKRIAAEQAAGHSDDSIIDAIVAENGKRALAAPPTQGFSLFAWTAPWIAIAIGLAVIWAFLRHLSAKPQPAANVDSEILDRYQDRIEKDLSKLD